MTSEMLMVLFVQDISGAWRCKSIGHPPRGDVHGRQHGSAEERKRKHDGYDEPQGRHLTWQHSTLAFCSPDAQAPRRSPLDGGAEVVSALELDETAHRDDGRDEGLVEQLRGGAPAEVAHRERSSVPERTSDSPAISVSEGML